MVDDIFFALGITVAIFAILAFLVLAASFASTYLGPLGGLAVIMFLLIFVCIFLVVADSY